MSHVGKGTVAGQILTWDGDKPVWTMGETPASIMGANAVGWWRSDLDVALNATNVVNAWIDQAGSSYGLSSLNTHPSFQPAGGPLGRPSILFDGSDDTLRNPVINRPAPSVTPTVVWMIFRLVTWTSTRQVFGFGANSNHMNGNLSGASPQIGQQNNAAVVNLNGALALNTYGRGEWGFTGSVADYVKLAGTTVTGASATNTDPAAGFNLGSGSSPSAFGNIEVCELAIFDAAPSATQTAALDAYVTNLYGPGLV